MRLAFPASTHGRTALAVLVLAVVLAVLAVVLAVLAVVLAVLAVVEPMKRQKPSPRLSPWLRLAFAGSAPWSTRGDAKRLSPRGHWWDTMPSRRTSSPW
jgi:hypothetical protein